MNDTPVTVSQEAIAREMRHLAQRIETLAVILGSDPAVARAHGKLLQQFDELAQIQIALAKIIEGEDGRLRHIGLDALTERLTSV